MTSDLLDFSRVPRRVIEAVRASGVEFQPGGSGDLPRSPPQRCFANCQRIAVRTPWLSYCEGIALAHGRLWTHHAWLIDAEGLALDPTWPVPGSGYIGVVFSDRQVINATRPRRGPRREGCLL